MLFLLSRPESPNESHEPCFSLLLVCVCVSFCWHGYASSALVSLCVCVFMCVFMNKRSTWKHLLYCCRHWPLPFLYTHTHTHTHTHTLTKYTPVLIPSMWSMKSTCVSIVLNNSQHPEPEGTKHQLYIELNIRIHLPQQELVLSLVLCTSYMNLCMWKCTFCASSQTLTSSVLYLTFTLKS